MKHRTALVPALALLLTLALASTVHANGGKATDGPQDQPNPSGFATNCQEFLGPLRSAIARGELEDELGVARFSASFNPGKHYGTVGEEQFLDALGIDTSCNP